MNISNNLSQIIKENTEQDSIKGIACNFFKKIFKCDGITEEKNDFESKDAKTTKVAKGIPSLDYLIPLHPSLPGLYFKTETKGKNHIDNPIFSFGFHGKIHLRPPQNTI
ncbi:MULTISPECIES: hypothetical protein [unclassified Flavobacterium]|uniref:hypothetical protein n=1 Tax=unclassified Flavobacterium TaxID=196869 RepID=UPI001E567D06|nr:MULTISPECIES: hypothetical protein [unclassified Flavobacterium]